MPEEEEEEEEDEGDKVDVASGIDRLAVDGTESTGRR